MKITLHKNQSNYHPENAHALATLAQLAYSDEASALVESQKHGFENCKFFDHDSTQCFIFSNSENVVLSFRGTEPDKIQDILADLDTLQTDGPWGHKVHEGFWKALDLVFPHLIPEVETVLNNKQSFYVTGHSLGAALATLAAARFAHEKSFVPTAIYTFGQPRVGEPRFGGFYDTEIRNRHFRFVNNNDVVTRVPLESFGIGPLSLEYTHVGSLIYITSKKKLAPKITVWDRISGRLRSLISGHYFDGFDDHGMENYVQAAAVNINVNPFIKQSK